MIDATFKSPDVFKKYRQQLENAPQEFGKFLEGTARGRLQQMADERLGHIPGAVKRPIMWRPAFTQDKAANVRLPGIAYYSKQKEAYFATNGFGRGIGAPRTGAIANSWVTVVNITEGSIGLRNVHPAAKFVIGKRMQRFHENTGWKREDKIAFEILTSPDMMNLLGDGWQDVVDIGKSIS